MRHRERYLAGVVFLAGILVYANGVFNGFIIGDDEDQILRNPLVQSVGAIPELFGGSTYFRAESGEQWGLFYRPLMLTVYATVYALAGPNPIWFHLVQIGLHAINGVLVYVLFRRLLANPAVDSGMETMWALAGALLWVVHPLNGEAVLPIASLQEVLFLGLGLLAVLLVDEYSRAREKEWVFAMILVMLLALLAKETAVIWLAGILAHAWLRQRQAVKLTALAAGASLLAYLGLRLGVAKVGWGGNAIGRMAEATWGERLMQIPAIWWRYLVTFAWPEQLVVHQYWVVDELSWQGFWGPLAGVVGFLGVILGIYIWIKLNHKAYVRTYIYFMGLFLAGLVAHSQIVPLYATVAERWFYLPMVGLIGMLMSFLKIKTHSSELKAITNNSKLGKARILKFETKDVEESERNFSLRWVGVWVDQLKTQNSKLRTLTQSSKLLFVVVVILGLSVRTVIRTFDWRDSKRLFLRDFRVSQHDYYLGNLVGTVYIREREYALARPYLEDSVATYPFFGNVSNLATVEMHGGNYERARELFAQAVVLGKNYQAYQNYANFLVYAAEDYEGARRFAGQALMEYPYGGEMWLVLAQAAYRLEDVQTATVAAQRAYELAPMPLSRAVWEQVSAEHELAVEEYLEW